MRDRHSQPARNEREVVLEILTKIREDDVYSNIAVRQALDLCMSMNARQRAFIKRLAEGVIERRIELDAVIRAHTRRGSRIRPVVRDILRMGIYQILFMDSVPDSAACNESVKLAGRNGMAGYSGFVNGVLRSIAREHAADMSAERDRGRKRAHGPKESADTRHKDGEGEVRLAPGGHSLEEEAAKASMPLWIAEMWERDLGPDRTLRLMRAFLEPRPVTVRVDERLSASEREQLLARLHEKGVRTEPGRFLPYAFNLYSTSRLNELPGFREGLWTVQDESSQMAAEALGLHGGEIVYDLCAAPGGKTMHCASKLEALGRGGEVHAFDLSVRKTAQIRENVLRMRLDNVKILERDATEPHPEEAGAADVLVCDLPCSGLGVIGRKKDIKYRMKPEQLKDLSVLQRQILRAGIGYLKSGGTLLYSTCTIDRLENEEIAAYIEGELGLMPDPLQPCLPANVTGICGNQLQLLPCEQGTDGFFMAKFRKP